MTKDNLDWFLPLIVAIIGIMALLSFLFIYLDNRIDNLEAKQKPQCHNETRLVTITSMARSECTSIKGFDSGKTECSLNIVQEVCK